MFSFNIMPNQHSSSTPCHLTSVLLCNELLNFVQISLWSAPVGFYSLFSVAAAFSPSLPFHHSQEKSLNQFLSKYCIYSSSENTTNSPQHSVIVTSITQNHREKDVLSWFWGIFFFLCSRVFTNYYRKLDDKTLAL